MRGFFIGRGSPSPTPPWLEEAIAVYVAFGICVAALLWFSPGFSKKLRLEFSSKCAREYRTFTLLVLLFWPGLWFWDYALTGGERKKKPNQPLQRNAGSRPSSDDSPASETPSSLGPRG